MTVHPRKALASIEIPAHGGLDYLELERLNWQPQDVLDFSANLNPSGPPAAARRAAAEAAIGRYPDAEANALRRRLAEHLSSSTIGVSDAQIVVANGSSELLWLLALAYLDPGDVVAVVGPTFGEYERSAALLGANVRVYRAAAERNFQVDLAALREQLANWRPKLLFLCNPNNPTGTYLDHDSVSSLCSGDRLLVLDEAYAGFVDEPWCSLDLITDGVLLLRSMTKDFGLAGLRLGYAVGSTDVIAALGKARPPWNVNAAAQAAGLACLAESGYPKTVRRELRANAGYLTTRLSSLGLRVIPTDTHFFLLHVGNGRQLRDRLLRDGLLVRDCSSFGLPEFVRIAARSRADCERLTAAIERAIGELR